MAPLARLFFDFRGRIGRKEWWIGEIVLFSIAALLLAVRVLIQDFDLRNPPPDTIADTILGLALGVPMLALTVKRLNDRDQPFWLGIIVGVVMLSSRVAPHFGFPTDLTELSKSAITAVFALGIFGLWIFIDNGFLKGTPGPNRYGSDPLAPSQGGAEREPSPRLRRRSIGRYVRDGIAAAASLVLVAAWFAPPGFAGRMFKWAITPAEFQLLLDRQANEPASTAERDGYKASRDRNREAAIDSFTRAIALYGPNQAVAAQAYRARAWELHRIGKLEEALSDYSKAITLEPDWPSSYRERAIVLADLGRHSDALAGLNVAISKNPDDASAYIARGRALEKLGRGSEALASYVDAAAAAERRHERNVKLWERTEIDKGEQAPWRGKLRRDRDGVIARAHFQHGNALRDLGRRDDALTSYAAALQRWPDYRSVYINRGWLYEKSGHPALARADYEKASALSAPDAWLTRALERTR